MRFSGESVHSFSRILKGADSCPQVQNIKGPVLLRANNGANPVAGGMEEERSDLTNRRGRGRLHKEA